jgi:hypothetical protein
MTLIFLLNTFIILIKVTKITINNKTMGFETFKAPAPEKNEPKENIWKKINKYGKIMALVALLSLPEAKSAIAQDTNRGEKSDSKVKIETLFKEAAQHVKNITPIIKEKGQSGKWNGITVRSLENEKGTSATFGFDDKGETKWEIVDSNTGSLNILDSNADGKVDRFITNKEADLPSNQKKGFNHLKNFQSIEELAEEAKTIASLDPEKVEVFDISHKNEKIEIKIVNFETGEATLLSGPDAENLANTFQKGFTNSLEGFYK